MRTDDWPDRMRIRVAYPRLTILCLMIVQMAGVFWLVFRYGLGAGAIAVVAMSLVRVDEAVQVHAGTEGDL